MRTLSADERVHIERMRRPEYRRSAIERRLRRVRQDEGDLLHDVGEASLAGDRSRARSCQARLPGIRAEIEELEAALAVLGPVPERSGA